MDKIRIKGLRVYAYHGVFEEERIRGQHFYINAILHTDLRPAGKSDDLTLSTHYGLVCDELCEYVKNNTSLLIETVAEGAASHILRKFPLIKTIELEIQKPEAPVDHSFDTVSVEVTRGWHDVYISFGSNIGNREEHICCGLDMLRSHPDIRVERVSDLIVTEPYGGVEQDDFINGALHIVTMLNPSELLEVLHGIEASRNRQRIVRWGPRTLDLDILLYDDIIYNTEELTIPHIDMANRDFVLRPLAQIAGWRIHPVTGRSIADMLKDLVS